MTQNSMITSISPVFNSVCTRITFRAGRGKTHFVMVYVKKEDDFDYVIALQFSPDSHHLVYLAAQKDNWFLVRDGKHPTDWVADFFGVTFSPDSNRMAFAASLPNKRQALILDNVKCEEFNMVSSPIF